MTSVIPLRLTYDNTNIQGPNIHFSNVQAEDLFLYAPVLTKDLDLNKKVQRIFTQTYRYISLFAMEQCFNQIQQVVLGGQGKQKILVNGDLIYSLALVCTFPQIQISQQLLDPVNYPNDTQRFTIRQFSYVTNFGPSLLQKATFYIQSTAIDQNSDINGIILNRLFRRIDQRFYYDQLIGHTQELTTMSSTQKAFKVYSPLRMFFSDSPQKSFQYLRAGQPDIYLDLSLRQLQNLVCQTRNLTQGATCQSAQPFNWAGVQYQELGLVTWEIFLGEHERIIHAYVSDHRIIEQNVNFTQKIQSTSQISQPTQFVHPTKFMYWGIQKAKYKSGLFYLSQKSFVDPVNTLTDLLQDATMRFIMRYAQYIGQVNYNDVSGYTNSSTLAATTTSISGSSLVLANINQVPDSNLLLTYAMDAYDIIQSMFSTQNGFSGVSTELNNSQLSIDGIFKRIQPFALQVNSEQRFDQNSVILQNGTLTLDECSIDIATLDSHVSVPVYVAKHAVSNTAQFNFSQYSQGQVTFQYGSTQQFVGTLVTSAGNGSGLFSAVTKEVKFNYGLSDFDVCHQSYDNFGKYLNKTGELIETSELGIGSSQRFSQSSYYTSKLNVERSFPGKLPEGVQIYSFAIDPCQIQPSGTLNLSRSNIQTVIQNTAENNDDLYISIVCYNIMDFREQTSQVLYATSMQ